MLLNYLQGKKNIYDLLSHMVVSWGSYKVSYKDLKNIKFVLLEQINIFLIHPSNFQYLLDPFGIWSAQKVQK